MSPTQHERTLAHLVSLMQQSKTLIYVSDPRYGLPEPLLCRGERPDAIAEYTGMRHFVIGLAVTDATYASDETLARIRAFLQMAPFEGRHYPVWVSVPAAVTIEAEAAYMAAFGTQMLGKRIRVFGVE